MAGHEVVVVTVKAKPTTTRKKRRLHPIRRLARLLLRTCSCSRPKEHGVIIADHEHTCRGPSVLSNLLPILEPLLTLDPKLLFIENHILGRTQQAVHNNGPTCDIGSSITTLDERKARSEKKESAHCDCDVCAPKLYRLSEKSAHGVIEYGVSYRKEPGFSHTLLYSSETTVLPLPQLSLHFYGTYESMRLVRHHAAWLDSTYLQHHHPSILLSTTPAIQQLRSLLRVWRPHLSSPDLRQSMSVPQMQCVIRQLNEVFFHGAVPPHRSALSTGFAYLHDGWRVDDEGCLLGVGTYNALVGTQVLLHPVLHRRPNPNNPTTNSSNLLNPNADVDVDIEATIRFTSRLGTLLHELCHAFLKAYTCRSCPMHDVCVGPRGHGRAWQVLAERVEVVAGRVVGEKVDLGRGEAVISDLKVGG